MECRLLLLLPSLFILTCCLGAFSPRVSAMSPTDTRVHREPIPAMLRCEYRVDPLGIASPSPRLSWQIASSRRGEVQTAYRILVSSDYQRLQRHDGDLWDSGRVESADTTHVAYAGRPLTSRQRCWWKVMFWDRDGVASPWSAAASWEMGLLEPTDWTAEWIDATPEPAAITIERATYLTIDGTVQKDVTGIVAELAARGESIVASNTVLGGDPAFGTPKRLEIVYRSNGAQLRIEVAENAVAKLADGALPYLRRTFAVHDQVVQARLYVTALGLYEVSLNGFRIGDHHLAPGWTDYRRRVPYQVFDVTNHLRNGRNTIGAVVAPGWFSGRAGLFNIREFYGASPALLAQLEITYADGTRGVIASDGTWRRHAGPIVSADLMDGEICNGGAAIPGWDHPDFDDDGWDAVSTRREERTLEAAIDDPVRVLDELPARSVTEPAPGRWTFDLGQNMVGVVRLRLEPEWVAPGTIITLRHGEMLNPDGTIYTANLRGAAATDTYICRGDGTIEEWQPQFTFHGFRYVELTGLTRGRPGTECVTGVALGSDVPVAGRFRCSDPALNQLQSNILWGMRGNYLSIPTDCPQRDERMGWMADTQVFAPTAAWNADIALFMTKWMTDVRDAQRADGAHSDVAPVTRGLSYGTPAWADAGVIVPWDMYQQYGDRRILEDNIESMIAWVEWCRAHSTDLIRDRDRGNDYGDWLSIDAVTPKDLIGTAYFAHSTDVVARSLRVLERDVEAIQYEGLFEEIKQAFIARYVDDDGRVHGNTQCGYLLALRFNLLPDAMRPKAVQHLVDDLAARDWRLSTGFVGVAHLLPVLTAVGREDIAHRVLMQDAFPSWLFSVRHGATTIWERWNGWTPETGPHPDISMNSFNHYAFGSCGEWFYEGIAGIEPDPAHPGFSHFFIRPRLWGSTLSWAEAEYESLHGRIESRWSIEGDILILRVAVPSNTTATVHLPIGQPLPASQVVSTPPISSSAVVQGVRESGKSLSEAEGVEVAGHTRAGLIVRVRSGEYVFTLRWTEAPEDAANEGRH